MSNLKPFDLEKALAGDPVVTRDGKSVSQITLFKGVAESYFPLVSVHETGYYIYSLIDGTQSSNSNSNSALDLFMAPKKVKYYFASWTGMSSHHEGRFTSPLHPDKNFIISNYGPFTGRENCIIHEIEIEE